MDGVKRFNCTNGGARICNGCYQMDEDDDGLYVFASDFDAALAREAALREELARVNSAWHDMKQASDIIKQRLTAAEQRNATIETAIRHTLDDSSEDAQTGEITIMRLDYETLSALIDEPTESGASE